MKRGQFFVCQDNIWQTLPPLSMLFIHEPTIPACIEVDWRINIIAKCMNFGWNGARTVELSSSFTTGHQQQNGASFLKSKMYEISDTVKSWRPTVWYLAYKSPSYMIQLDGIHALTVMYDLTWGAWTTVRNLLFLQKSPRGKLFLAHKYVIFDDMKTFEYPSKYSDSVSLPKWYLWNKIKNY